MPQSQWAMGYFINEHFNIAIKLRWMETESKFDMKRFKALICLPCWHFVKSMIIFFSKMSMEFARIFIFSCYQLHCCPSNTYRESWIFFSHQQAIIFSLKKWNRRKTILWKGSVNWWEKQTNKQPNQWEEMWSEVGVEIFSNCVVRIDDNNCWWASGPPPKIAKSNVKLFFELVKYVPATER